MNYLIKLTQKCRGLAFRQTIWLICATVLLIPARGLAQKVKGWELEKMPQDLESKLALSALPPHLRAEATVYLLDPTKGYYVSQKGSNGFVCFIDRTDWEWGEFRKDVIAPIAYDPEGARTIFPLYQDVAAMRASGSFTPIQIKDTVIARIRNGIYKAPSKAGVSYMLAPIMRVYTGKPGDENVMTMHMPHYMFYAPYINETDVGFDNNSPQGPWIINAGNTVLGDGHGPHGYFIVPAFDNAKAKILQDNKDLLQRLSDYSPLFRVDAGTMHH